MSRFLPSNRLASLGCAGLLLAIPWPLQAAPPPSGEGLFISPFGEPFRSAAGLADWFSAADADRNGILTIKEFTDDGLRFHARLDADRDGRVDGFENTTYENQVAPEILPQSAAFRSEQSGATAPAPRARGLDGASSFGLLDEPQPVRGADRNFDGRVTADEQTLAAARRFTLLETTPGEGLTLPELESRLKARQPPPPGAGWFFRRRPG